jgi:hypothetical protein
MSEGTSRRKFFCQTLAGAAGIGAAYSLEERILLAALAQEKPAETAPPAPTQSDPATFPCGMIGDLKISRLLMGGNLIGGWAHSRDLLYTSELFKAYNTEEKIFETLALGEQQGINTIQIDPQCQNVVEKYKRERGGKIQTMVCVSPNKDEAKMRDDVRRIVDQGATTLYTHGNGTDACARDNDVETLGKALDLFKKEGLKAGLGGHSLKNIVLSEENNLNPDYYVKTLHTDRYWSAIPEEHRKEFCWQMPMESDRNGYHDNMFCLNPQETIDYMAKVKRPWVAFKVLAAGAIAAEVGFSYALRYGADFIIVGMFDFQVARNVDLARRLVDRNQSRDRGWYA